MSDDEKPCIARTAAEAIGDVNRVELLAGRASALRRLLSAFPVDL